MAGQASIDRLAAQVALLRDQVAALQDDSRIIATTAEDLSSSWLILCGALVFFMQTGFAMLETGVVAKHNVVNVLFKNVVDACLAGVMFWLVGYGFAYGKTWRGFIGTSNFALTSHQAAILDVDANVIVLGGYARWFYRWTFAGAAATIVSGSVCERIRIPTYMLFSACMSSVIYPVVVHWVWGDGFLSETANRTPDASEFRAFWTGKNGNGCLDLGGSGVVHMVGGLSGLTGAIIIGPRIARFDPITGVPRDMPEHNVTLMILGIGVLWFGWYGFNCGSVYSILQHSSTVAKVAVNTTISASTGCLVSTLVSVATQRYFDVTRMINGILAALVSITASADVVQPWMAFIIGGIGALVYYGASKLLVRFRVDDPLDASAVHAFCGMWGLLAAGIFCVDTTVQENKSPGAYGVIVLNDSCSSGLQFGMQVLAVVCITTWVVVMSSLVWLTLKYTVGLRVAPVVEEAGMDAAIHGRSGYGERDSTLGWVLETGGMSVHDEIRKRGLDYSEHPAPLGGTSPPKYDGNGNEPEWRGAAFYEERKIAEAEPFKRVPSLGIGPPFGLEAGHNTVPLHLSTRAQERHAPGHGSQQHLHRHQQQGQPMLMIAQPMQVKPYPNGQQGSPPPPPPQYPQPYGPALGQPQPSPQPFMIHMSPPQQNMQLVPQSMGQGQQGGYAVPAFAPRPPQQQQWAAP